VRTFQDVVDRGLCVGCGACAGVMPHQTVDLMHVSNQGIRPRFAEGTEETQKRYVFVCPGFGVTTIPYNGKQLEHLIGPTLGIWQAHAADPAIRFSASSGGALTAIAVYAINNGLVDAVLHTGMDPSKPWRNKTVVSRNCNDVILQSGSRYGSSSPCEGLRSIEDSDQVWMFIGKPCDVAAVRQLQASRSKLRNNLRYILTFFCAGAPHSDATLELTRELSVATDSIKSIRYRGNGWPGEFTVVDENGVQHQMSYAESWSRLQQGRSLRCHICPDGLGELGDISCGDAWDVYAGDDNPGLSYVLSRTDIGHRLVQEAMNSQALIGYPVEPERVVAAQQLISRRKELFGRLLAMRLMGLNTPRYRGFKLYKAWVECSLWMKLRSIFGTLRRYKRYRPVL